MISKHDHLHRNADVDIPGAEQEVMKVQYMMPNDQETERQNSKLEQGQMPQ